jgi:hypothetical protein
LVFLIVALSCGETAFVELLSSSDEMEYDAGELMCRRGDSLTLPKSGAHATVEIA